MVGIKIIIKYQPLRRSSIIRKVSDFGGTMKKLHFAEKNKMIFGVCEGLSNSTGIDVRLIRLGFIISIFYGGTGILVYLILFAILPKGLKDENIIDVEIEAEEGERRKYTKIYRTWENRMLAGVCSGFANYLKWDVSIIRLLFILMSFGGGIGIVLYLIFWFIFPNEENI